MQTYGIEKTLQQDHGGEAVYSRSALFDADAARAQHSGRLHRGEALVPELNGKSCILLQLGGKLARPVGLAARRPAHVQRISHQYLSDAPLPYDVPKCRQIGALVAARERREALGGNAEF